MQTLEFSPFIPVFGVGEEQAIKPLIWVYIQDDVISSD